jgi:hypothetical protein
MREDADAQSKENERGNKGILSRCNSGIPDSSKREQRQLKQIQSQLK